MRKILLVTVVIMMTFVGIQAFGVGIGVEGTGGVGGYGAYGYGGVMLTVKFDDAPYLAIGADFWQWGGYVGMTADWWLINNKIAGPLYWYLGVGPYLGMRWYNTNYWGSMYGNPPSFGFNVGVRVPIGLHVFPEKWFECFLEFAPSAGVGFWAFDGTAVYPDWHLQGSLGVRFWF